MELKWPYYWLLEGNFIIANANEIILGRCRGIFNLKFKDSYHALEECASHWFQS